FNVNLMTDAGQTHEMTAREHVETIKNYIGKYPDYVLINNKELPEEIVKKYIESEDYPVKDDLEENSDYEVVREDLISGSDEVEKKKDFGAKRSLIRHNSKSISNAIYNNILAKL
ncbi:MAG TPA: 2-phospho-L-lactate transferase CofD family protein, partial [Candidatus Dojkabacteria bacterium]